MRFFRVGGCVRDRVMGRTPKDIDYVVTLSPAEVAAGEVQGLTIFGTMITGLRQRGLTIFQENPEFYTVRAREGKTTHDYVLARRDGPSTDGRRPDYVMAGTLTDDLNRRDFTMNAMAETDDTVYDPHGGLLDIASKLIRTVGDPTVRFDEDRLRILRAVRFAVTLDFIIEGSAHDAVRKIAEDGEPFRGVSVERIREECVKMFSHDTVQSFRWLEMLKLTDSLFPKWGPLWLQPTTRLK